MPSFNGKKKTVYQNQIIQKLVGFRNSCNISQSKIARLLDRTPQTISLIEKSNSPNIYSLKQILTICKACDIDASYVFMDNKDVFNTKTQWEILDLLMKRISEYENSKR